MLVWEREEEEGRWNVSEVKRVLKVKREKKGTCSYPVISQERCQFKASLQRATRVDGEPLTAYKQ